MVYKNFRVNCTLRVVALAATIALFVYLLDRTALFATTLIVGGLVLYQVYSLIVYVEGTNRDLVRFLQAVKYADFTQTFSGGGLGSSFDELKAAFNDVIREFRQARTEKEEQYRYLQTVMQHVGIGLISFQANGEVDLINNAAKRLLRVPGLKRVQDLEPSSKPLADTLLRLQPGERALVKLDQDNELLQLVIYAREFRLRGKRFTLASIQNIHSELEEKEMEAWQNLIRVLTHEIMNSVTPIASLASTVNDLLADPKGDGQTLGDVRSAVQTIVRRSQGLLHFVDAYRNLTRIPKPNFQIFPVTELFDRVQQLMRGQMEAKGIRFRTSVDPETLELTADPELIEQVLINLLLNAIEAVEEKVERRIDLAARMDNRGRVVIQVADNGPGISEEALKKIFIPFFTTKKGGSGIGLSLSRQIMRLHHGTIGVHSEPDQQTVFTLRF